MAPLAPQGVSGSARSTGRLGGSHALRAGFGVSLGLGLAFALGEPSALAEVRGAPGGRSLGTVVNGTRDGGCSIGTCKITGGTSADRNLFHRFSAFDTRGGITDVRIQSDGFRNVILGVVNPLGSYVDKVVSLTSKGNLFMMSPGGITVGQGGSFQNIQHLQLSTATGLRIGDQLFSALSTTADQAALMSAEPMRGPWGQLSDPGALAELGLQGNGDLRLDGGLLTVEQSLLLDAQGGNVILQAAGVQAEGPSASVTLSGDAIRLANSRVDVSNSASVGGEIRLTSNTLELQSSVLDASGGTTGGTIVLSGRERAQLTGSDLLAKGLSLIHI